VRYERRADILTAFLHLGCTLICAGKLRPAGSQLVELPVEAAIATLQAGHFNPTGTRCPHATIVGMPAPPATARLAFREMTPDDLDDMAGLLGDPQVMRYYPRPHSREQASAWIAWSQRLYRDHGFGLWLLTLRNGGEFVGDCGLTPQQVDGVT
jgi:RimJ/RimL family protein N-acetyltransferase